MRNSLQFIALIILLIPEGIWAQDSHTSKTAEILKSEVDSVIQAAIKNDRIPGAVILIKEKGKVLLKKAYGYAQKYDYEGKAINSPEMMSVNHMFDIASLTKAIGTTTSIMLLADKGQINIDDPAGKYIGTFRKSDKENITIRNLLTHTAGLYEWYPMYYRATNKEECFRLIGDLPLKYNVGEQRRYSDLGFTVLGQIIETVSGQPLDEYMRENIFIPLGMKNTSFNPLKSGKYKKIAATSPGNPYEYRMVHDSSLGYSFSDIDPDGWNGWRKYMLRGEVNDGNAWYANGGVSGAAGLFSTADDLQKIVDMLINEGTSGRSQFISGLTVSTFLSKDKFNNGLGWMMDPENSFMRKAPEGSFGHTGFTGTSIVVIPKYGISVILLFNRQNNGLLQSGEYYNVNTVRQDVFNVVMKYLNEE